MEKTVRNKINHKFQISKQLKTWSIGTWNLFAPLDRVNYFELRICNLFAVLELEIWNFN